MKPSRNLSALILWVIVIVGIAISACGYWGMAHAGEIDSRFDNRSCYTWEGGLGAQGSFTSCDPTIVLVPRTIERVVTVREPAPPAPAPLIIREQCEQSQAAPVMKKRFRPKPKPIDCLK